MKGEASPALNWPPTFQVAGRHAGLQYRRVRIRFLLGPAGSGKTHQCVEEARARLEASPDGAPLLFIVPKQATYQIERQILAPPGPGGFTRLRIVSFERLANLLFKMAGQAEPPLLDEEGRFMVLRSLLDKAARELSVFSKSARRAGFAQELSRQLREFEHHQFDPGQLEVLAAANGLPSGLSGKLSDLAALWKAYRAWLDSRKLRDGNELPRAACEILAKPPSGNAIYFERIWVDGFAVLTPSERSLLTALIPRCGEVSLAFCLDADDGEPLDSLSPWSVVRRTYQTCRGAFQAAVPDARQRVELLPRSNPRGRFAGTRVLAALEAAWCAGTAAESFPATEVRQAARVVACPNPQGEAEFCAREILKFVREGGRFREVGLVARVLTSYATAIRRAFTRHGIPHFLDQREPVSHHPLAELTRGLLGVVAFGCRQSDLFRVFKSGFNEEDPAALDELENLALEFGLEGRCWLEGFGARLSPGRLEWAEPVRARLMEPLARLKADLGVEPSGRNLAEGLRTCWETMRVQSVVEEWAARDQSPVHATVLEQMRAWLLNLERAFDGHPLPLAEWLGVAETGLAALTVGVIPPALDQVMVGSIDRSRNPELRRVFILGANEGVFPQALSEESLLTEQDRLSLAERGSPLALRREDRVSLEHFFGYIACTRAREGLVITHALADSAGKRLNPSRFISHLKRILPGLAEEKASDFILARGGVGEVEHVSEVLPDLLKWRAAGGEISIAGLANHAGFPAPILRGGYLPTGSERLSAAVAQELFKNRLQTSVSGMEAFAACPFKFFAQDTLRARERVLFQFERKEQGVFQHEVLSLFHRELKLGCLKWRDIDPEDARNRVERLGWQVAATQGHDPQSTPEGTRHSIAARIRVLQDYAAWAVAMNQTACEFDPELSEIPLGMEGGLPGWTIRLDGGGELELLGRIDRVDIHHSPDSSTQYIVLDYKSSAQKPDRVKIENGLQLQLLAYAAALREIEGAAGALRSDGRRLLPVGVFYIPLKATTATAKTRGEALDKAGEATFPHAGLFDLSALGQFDSRPGGRSSGQFQYKLTKAGVPYKGSFNALPPGQFQEWLDRVRALLGDFASRVLSGEMGVSPYRQKTHTPCDHCAHRGVCRTDPWEQSYRALAATEPEPE